jgi:hypothetical protein
MSHENSITIEDEDGKWINVSGHTGEILKPIHKFEKERYDTMDEAVAAAEKRSYLFGGGMLSPKEDLEFLASEYATGD